MVFTPAQPLDLASAGLSTASPRAVPLDALVAIAEKFVDGAVVGRLAVLVPLVVVGVGVARLLSSRALSARLAACTFAVWSPFVVERMALGQWALVCAYAALPWLLVAVLWGRGWPGWFARAVALAAASITPTGGLIAATAAVVTIAMSRRPGREVIAVAALGIALQLPWLLPAVMSPAASTSDPAAVAAFAARAEHPGGVFASLLGGGGIWDADVVPHSRDAALLPWLGLLVVAIAACYGARPLIALVGTRPIAALGVLSAAGLVLATLSSVPGGAELVRWAVNHLPGAGLLRDAQKWIMPLVLGEALLVGAAVDRLAAGLRANRRPMHWLAMPGLVAIATPMLLLPDGPATLRPTFAPVHYPHDWSVVAARVHGGDAIVLPFGSYRRFDWAPGRSGLDPAPRLLPVPTVVDDRLAVAGRLLAGEDPRAADVAVALGLGAGLPARLARLGISWVVVEHGTPGTVPDLSGLRATLISRDVSLYRVPGPVSARRPAGVKIVIVLAGDAVAVIGLVALLGAAAAARRRRRFTNDRG